MLRVAPSTPGTLVEAGAEAGPPTTGAVIALGIAGACTAAGGAATAAFAACSAEAVAPVASEPSASARLIWAWPMVWAPWAVPEAFPGFADAIRTVVLIVLAGDPERVRERGGIHAPGAYDAAPGTRGGGTPVPGRPPKWPQLTLAPPAAPVPLTTGVARTAFELPASWPVPPAALGSEMHRGRGC